MQKVKLLRPLDGRPEGEIAEYPVLDAAHLVELGVVELLDDAPSEPEAPASEATPPKRQKKAAN